MSNGLQIREAASMGEWQIMREQAAMLVKTNFLPPAIKTPEQALAIILTGRELGIGAMAALNNINVIAGKPTVSPQLMLALINSTKQLEDISITDDGRTCSVTMKRLGRKPHTETFSMEDAARMKTTEYQGGEKRIVSLSEKYNWKQQPATMRKWRAVAACARVVFPDVILGLYTPEEMGAAVEPESGEVIMEPQCEVIQPDERASYTLPNNEPVAQSARPAPPPAPPVQLAAAPAPVQTPAPAVELVDLSTLHAIEKLWPQVGATLKGEKVSLRAWLSETKKISEPTEMPQELAVKVLDWLQKKALAKEGATAAPAQEPKASGLDQWQCTLDTNSRVLALDILNATKRLEAAGISEADWRAELNDMPGYDMPVSRKALTGEDAQVWLRTLTSWAARIEQAKEVSA